MIAHLLVSAATNLVEARANVAMVEVAFLKTDSHGRSFAQLDVETHDGRRSRLVARGTASSKARRLVETLNARHSDWSECWHVLPEPALLCASTGVVVTEFPADRRLSSLAEVTNPAVMLDHLSSLDCWRGETLAAVSPHVVRYKVDSKCVVRFDLRWAGSETSLPAAVWGKVSRPSARQRSTKALRRLATSGPADGFAFPVLLGVVEDLDLEVFTEVNGRPLAACPDAWPAIGHDLGTALRLFHSIDLGDRDRTPPGCVNDPPDGFDHRSLGGDSRDVGAIALEAATLLDQCREAEATCVHNDFHGHNVLVGGGCLSLIDLEDVGLGDPLNDLATMYAHLVALAHTTPAQAGPLEAMVRDMIRGYGAVSELDRLVALVALQLLERARHLDRHPSSPADLASALVGSAKHTLDRGLR